MYRGANDCFNTTYENGSQTVSVSFFVFLPVSTWTTFFCYIEKEIGTFIFVFPSRLRTTELQSFANYVF